METPSKEAAPATLKRGPEGRADKVLWIFLAVAVLIAFSPTFVKLVAGPWRTEQEGHGPLILAGAAWLAWQCRPRLQTVQFSPAPVSGWLVLLVGLIGLAITRSLDLVMVEVASQLPIICGCVLLVGGWRVLRILAFPIAFLVFAIPPPGWLLDAFTVPLKAMVSDWVAEILYDLDFPVAQNGVMIMIGPYQLLVKDACAGMNSIFALSAIGVFYIHEFVRNSKLRAFVLLLSIIPITIVANFVRVMSLVLIAYYYGIDAVEGIFHDLTGFALFVVALALFFFLDGIMILLAGLVRRLWRPYSPQALKAPPSSPSPLSIPGAGRTSPAN